MQIKARNPLLNLTESNNTEGGNVTTTTFRTEPFTCPSCVAKIETTVGRVDGVEKVDVKFNSSRVVVDHEEARASAVSIRKIIDDLGYPVKSVS